MTLMSQSQALAQEAATGRLLGLVVAGSLTHGLEVRLNAGADVESMAVGRYVSIHGREHTLFGMVTDIELRATSPVIEQSPPELEDEFLREVYLGAAAYAVLKVSPMLRIGREAGATPEPVKTVPAHFAAARDATESEVSQVFGEDDASHFPIGMPLDMDLEICLDAEKLVQRSTGVFGKTGTGKTYLARNILLHLISKSEQQRDISKRAVHLIFDMHNDYGWEAKNETTGRTVKGLKNLLGNSVAVMTLDPASSRRRGSPNDGEVVINYAEIEPQDLAVLQETLRLTPSAVEAANPLVKRFGQPDWIARTLALKGEREEIKALLGEETLHQGSFENLQRGLQRLERMEFLRTGSGADTLKQIMGHLAGGRSVVLEFGKYGDDLAAYMLVANVLTRRIHQRYREMVESEMGGGGPLVNHLVITIEEAHKFLSREVAGQTIFGEIAREMRKYHVTLLVIDQRPSAIDDEVMSQVGTKVSCLLDNEKDIDAVLSGVSGARDLRQVLAKLDSSQQALILGHAVPMPVVVRTTEYGSEESYARFKAKLGAASVNGSDDLYG